MSITVEQLQAHKEAMEKEIHAAVYKAMEKFNTATSYSPNSVYIELSRYHAMGKKNAEYRCIAVRCGVDVFGDD